MNDTGPSSNEERIRKVIGTAPESANPSRRVWRLRERMHDLGVEFEDDDERIRKVVGRSE